ncbi:alanyl-tRNA editing protein [Candidatus Woesearchaeota archaeon]|nr:alanyl-tRNA editing protein [Candidatus Woesearchaeota archaeon]
MSHAVFLEDCYVKELDAVVVSVDGVKVGLDRGIFCYQGGGQPSDRGVIHCNGSVYNVVDVRKDGAGIISFVDREGLKQGDLVHCVLDWERRYALMRGHTAMHVLSAIVHRTTGALITGGQIEIGGCRIDFSLEDFDREKVAAYVKEANDAISRNMPVRMYFMAREEALKVPGMVKLANAVPPDVSELRIVEIGDVDRQADGGTHVANTSEVGRIEIVKIENKGKSNRRIYFRLV